MSSSAIRNICSAILSLSAIVGIVSCNKLPSPPNGGDVPNEFEPPINGEDLSRNNYAVWIRQSDINNVDFDGLVDAGVNNIIVHEYIFNTDIHSVSEAVNFLSKARQYDIKIHIWMQCFWWKDLGWSNQVIDPIDGEPARYNTGLFDEIISRGISYLNSYGDYIDGIHLDYIRFGGTAHNHDFPEQGISGEGAINEFCKMACEKLKEKKENLILSAAVMGEFQLDVYGQNPAQMSNYIDVFMPMAYISSYGYSDNQNAELAEWFKSQVGNKQVWYGISTYNRSQNGLDSEILYHDCENIYKNSSVEGLALFRYGLGQLPDLKSLTAGSTSISNNQQKLTISRFVSAFAGVVDAWNQNITAGQNLGITLDEAHYIPGNFKLKIVSQYYNKSQLYDIALQSLSKLLDGGSLTNEIPEAHNYRWPESPYRENPGNGGTFATDTVGLDFILNYSGRQQGYAKSNGQWANFCNYTDANGNPVSKGEYPVEANKYKGCCCLERDFLIMARLFRYIRDNHIASDFSNALKEVEISSELY